MSDPCECMEEAIGHVRKLLVVTDLMEDESATIWDIIEELPKDQNHCLLERYGAPGTHSKIGTTGSCLILIKRCLGSACRSSWGTSCRDLTGFDRILHVLTGVRQSS